MITLLWVLILLTAQSIGAQVATLIIITRPRKSAPTMDLTDPYHTALPLPKAKRNGKSTWPNP